MAEDLSLGNATIVDGKINNPSIPNPTNVNLGEGEGEQDPEELEFLEHQDIRM